MERAILVIVLMVAIVGVVGIFTSYSFVASQDVLGSAKLTGNVVAGPAPASCGSCAGYSPVCAQINHRLISYQNACEATCAGAEIAVQGPCENIPRV